MDPDDEDSKQATEGSELDADAQPPPSQAADGFQPLLLAPSGSSFADLQVELNASFGDRFAGRGLTKKISSLSSYTERSQSPFDDLELNDEDDSPSHKTLSPMHRALSNLNTMLSANSPVVREHAERMKGSLEDLEMIQVLTELLELIEDAWSTPTIGRDFAYGLCDELRKAGGLDILVKNLTNPHRETRLYSARVLEQSMTVPNRDHVVRNALQPVVDFARECKMDKELTKYAVGILESLFKHSKKTSRELMNIGGLESILYSCRSNDTPSLRHCAVALANLAIFGGRRNQTVMIKHKVAEWLFPLALHKDDSTRYYALLAIASLSANKEIVSAVIKSGTLDLVEPFVQSHDPLKFAYSDRAHIQGQSVDWLRRLVPLLTSRREEAQSIAAFHFAMEAAIKAEQGKRELFHDIGAVKSLKQLASSTNAVAAKFAVQALEKIGEEIPHQLSPQVPLWTTEDVCHWLEQCGFKSLVPAFSEVEVDGDLLLQLTDDQLRDDLHVDNGITRRRFLREVKQLKMTADYQSVDPTNIWEWLKRINTELLQYVYHIVKSGASRDLLPKMSEELLQRECCMDNGVHRLMVMEALGRVSDHCPRCSLTDSTEGVAVPKKLIDCFISYRRSNGSQLASLLKVHLQLRGFSVFLDIERLGTGKFDENLLESIANSRNFILVLTTGALNRCIGDVDNIDWLHKEIVAAIEAGCKIIPVMDNFQFPAAENLPEDMRNVSRYNAITWVHDYQDACVDKLEKFITSKVTDSSWDATCNQGPQISHLYREISCPSPTRYSRDVSPSPPTRSHLARDASPSPAKTSHFLNPLPQISKGLKTLGQHLHDGRRESFGSNNDNGGDVT